MSRTSEFPMHVRATSRPVTNIQQSTLKTQRARSSSAPNRGTPPAQYPRRPQVGREASIGIRRMPASPALRQVAQQPNASTQGLNTLPVLDEDHELGQIDSSNGSDPTLTNPDQSRLRKVKSAMQVRIPFWGGKKDNEKTSPTAANAPAPADDPSANYSSGMVDVLDTLDPEVATLTSLTNMQNSLFIPNLPFLNRRPTYNLRRRKSAEESLEEINRILQPALAAQAEEQHAGPRLQRSETEATTATLMTIDSQLSESRFAVLPEDTDLSGWSVADKKEVNDHVRHMLHSRRSRMKRSLKGFGHYVRRRKFVLCSYADPLLTHSSTRLLSYSLRLSHYRFRTRVGTLLDRLGQRRRTKDLCGPRHRQCASRPLRRRW